MASAYLGVSMRNAFPIRKWALLYAAALLAGTLWCCSEKAKNPVGFGLAEGEGPWQTHQVIAQELLADSCISVTAGAGKGYYLLVGSWGEQEMRSLLRFEDLPDTLGLPLIGASLTLIAYSEANEESLSISVHALQSAWDDSAVTWEQPWNQPGGDFAGEAIAQEQYAVETSSRLVLEFDSAGVELVTGWLEGGPNNGILVKATDPQTDNLKYFYSENYSYYEPFLTLKFATGDTTDTTVSVLNAKDVSLFQPGTPVEEDVLCVCDGIVWRTWLHFDLPVIPDSVFVNRATLSLTMKEFSSPRDLMYLGVYAVTDMQTLEFSPGLKGYTSLSSDKELVEITLNTLVQDWADGAENTGFILKPSPEYSDLSRAFFYTSTADSSQRPTLTIMYTARPKVSSTLVPSGDLTQ
jgi:hypothetical protein